MRAAELLGRTAYDATGRRLGRVVDMVVATGGPRRRLRLRGLVVAPHWYGRLVGPDRDSTRGPWLIAVLARWMRRNNRVMSVSEVWFDPPVPGYPTGPLAGRATWADDTDTERRRLS